MLDVPEHSLINRCLKHSVDPKTGQRDAAALVVKAQELRKRSAYEQTDQKVRRAAGKFHNMMMAKKRKQPQQAPVPKFETQKDKLERARITKVVKKQREGETACIDFYNALPLPKHALQSPRAAASSPRTGAFPYNP